MKIINKINNNVLSAIHDNGPKYPEDKRLFFSCISELENNPNKFTYDNISIVTVTNIHSTLNIDNQIKQDVIENDWNIYAHRYKPTIQYCCELGGFDMSKFFLLLSDPSKRFNYADKISLYVENKDKIQTDYVLLCDSHDVILSDLDLLMDSFLNGRYKNYDVVFNGEMNYWPPTTKFKQQELDIFKTNTETMGRGKTPLVTFLNSGFVVARKSTYDKIMQEAYGLGEISEHMRDDQGMMKRSYVNHSDSICLDYYGDFVLAYHGMSVDNISVI